MTELSNIYKLGQFVPVEQSYEIKYKPLVKSRSISVQDGETVIVDQPDVEDSHIEVIQERVREMEETMAQKNQDMIMKATTKIANESAIATKQSQKEKEEILEQAKAEAGELTAQAKKDGYDQGIAQAEESISLFMKEFTELLGEIKEHHQTEIMEITEKISFMSMDIAESILHKKIEQNEMELVSLVIDAIEENRFDDWTAVELPAHMDRLIQHVETHFVKKIEEFKIIHKKSVDGETNLIIDTPHGIVDFSIKTQLDNLREIIRDY